MVGMLRHRWVMIVALLAALASMARPAVAADYDLELVLAVDVSRSIDDEEFALQRQGYAEAFMHPAVLNAIAANPHQKIAVTFIEYAGVEFQKIVVPWMVVGDSESGAIFADLILRQPRSFFGWTSISGAIDFSMQTLAVNPFRGTRRVIDVSGDGINNSGRPSNESRDAAVAAGVTINGIVIMNDRQPGGLFLSPQPPLDEFYRDNVIGGPGAFLIVVEDFSSFAYAIVNKLVKEIAAAPAPSEPARAGLDEADEARALAALD